jgi:hypothetical protein
MSFPLDIAPVRPDPAASAQRSILARAGASRPRDAVDARVIQYVQTRGGGLIDSEAEAGGWPELEKGRPWTDGDGDGMPDAWEQRQKLDAANPGDGAQDHDGDGYTNLEEWLAELAG